MFASYAPKEWGCLGTTANRQGSRTRTVQTDCGPRERVLGCFRAGDCLVDVGNTFDPARHLFDHKPPAFPSRHDSCAAKLVWEHLLALGKPVQHLEQLVLAVFAWDSVKRRKEFGE